MNLLIEIPESYLSERRYIISVLFEDYLGLDITLRGGARIDVCISDGEHRNLIIADGLFETQEEEWLLDSTLPVLPLKRWNPSKSGINIDNMPTEIPILYGKDPLKADFVVLTETHVDLGLDILGSCFFMLTRYEEVVRRERDDHGRFPASASVAVKEGFLDRPIVNEYVEILWFCLERLWPGLKRKPRQFRVCPTHDVDVPLKYANRSNVEIVKSVLTDIKSAKTPYSAIEEMQNLWQRIVNFKSDPFDTYGWLMQQSERIGAKAAFYFKANLREGKRDPSYRLDHPVLKERIQEIVQRGHEVGFHPGYYTYLNGEEWFAQLDNLKRSMPQAGTITGGRQHFLRFEVPFTWRLWEAAGMRYESTLGFAEQIGYRSGTCYEYPVYDLVRRRQLKLRERPLLVMDRTLFQHSYIGQGRDRAWRKVKAIKEGVKSFRGDFVFLWHNSNLWSDDDKRFFKNVLQ